MLHCPNSRHFIAFTAILTLLISTDAVAWEQDVHYILTFWLAIQAGFSRDDATRIAEGDQSYDDSAHAGAVPTVLWIGLTGDVGAAESVRDKHFASDAPVPSPPQIRIVRPNSPPARRELDNLLSPVGSANVRRLGQALHPFQDSWSHQGVPDVPLGMRPNLSYAHPESRGGWWSHDADLTHLHVPEVIEVAQRTYEAFQKFLDTYPRFREHAPIDWSALDPTVREFAIANSKATKDAWAVRYLDPQLVPQAHETLIASSLPSGQVLVAGTQVKETVRVLTPTSEMRNGLRAALTSNPRSAPPPLVATAQRFVTTWFRDQNISEAIGYVEWGRLQRQFDENQQRLIGNAGGILSWCERFMTSQLVIDHGLVNALGHGDPRHPRYAELPRSQQPEGPFRSIPPTEIAVTADSFFDAPGIGSGSFAMILNATNSMHDSVAIGWQRISGNTWKITFMAASID